MWGFGVFSKLLVFKKYPQEGVPMLTVAHRIDRRRFGALVAAAGGAMAALTVPARAQSRPDKGRVVIAAAGKSSLYYLPLTLAYQLGYFKAQGLDVEWLDVPDESRAAQALTTGAADVAAAPFENTLMLQSKGQAVRAFVLAGRAPQIALGVSLRTLSSFNGMQDLRGKTIGIDSLGSSCHVLTALVLARARMTPADVNFASVGTGSDALAALRTGQIDALAGTDPAMTMLEHKGDVRIVTDTRSLRGSQQLFGGPMPAACLYAPTEFVQKQTATCQALAHAVVHSLKWLQTAGPSDLIKTVPEAYMLGDRALYLSAFNKVREAFALDGVMPEEGPRNALAAVAAFDASIAASKIDLGKAFTNEYALKAKVRFKA